MTAACRRCKPLGFHLFGNLIAHRGAGRAGALRIFEREGIRIADLVDEAQRVGEILLGLAREADDEIRREREIGPRGAQPVDACADSPRGCACGSSLRECDPSRTAPADEAAAPAAADRDAPRSGRRRRRTDGWSCSAARAMPGISATRRSRPPSVQARPSRSVAVIRVDVLPDQRDLAHAGAREVRHFGDDLLDRARNFRAARIGHDAEGAELVAAFLHGDESASRRARAIAALLGAGRNANLSSTGNSVSTIPVSCRSRAREQIRQAVIALRPDHEVDDRRAADDLRAFGLRDAARDRDRHAAALPARPRSFRSRIRPSSE